MGQGKKSMYQSDGEACWMVNQILPQLMLILLRDTTCRSTDHAVRAFHTLRLKVGATWTVGFGIHT